MNITPQMARAELARRELAKRQSQSAPTQPEQQGIGSIPGDIGNAGMNLLMGAGEKAMMFPDEIQAAGEQIGQNPLSAVPRAVGSVLSSMLEGGKQLYNLPWNINTYLASKNVPVFKQTAPLAEKFKIGDTGLQKAVMGEPQRGDELWEDAGSLLSVVAAPEALGARIPAVTSKGIIKHISADKAKALSAAKADFGGLFKQAADEGLTHAAPIKAVTKPSADIIKNSQPKYHNSYREYLSDPTLENAHWAQSELGALQRHLDEIAKKTGLTPSQIKTYKGVVDARQGIRKSMFSDNLMGSRPELAKNYDVLAKKYKDTVVPFTRLENLSAYEAGQLLPKTAVKGLTKDDQFMIELSKRYPGLKLRNPMVKSAAVSVGALLGYDEIKKLLSNK